MKHAKELLTIGQMAKRSGLATSTLRFYEQQGLIESQRNSGNQRRYQRSQLRRISVVRIAQSVGLSLAEIKQAFELLPDQRTPTRKDWERLSSTWRDTLDQRINELVSLRDQLTSCIGCGCLSLRNCSLYNSDDYMAERGAGAQLLVNRK